MGNDVTASSTRSFELKPEHDIRNVHGAPGWHELTTPDPDGAAAYLAGLYGWEFRTMDIGGSDYRVIVVEGHEVGGVRAPMPGDDDVPRWDTYVTVEDVDALAGRAADLGGEVVVPPMRVGEAGRLTVLNHPTAGKLSAFEYRRPFS